MKPSYEDNSIQFVSKPFRILDKKKTELAKIGKFMPSCTIKVAFWLCVTVIRVMNGVFYLEGLHEGSTNTQANILITN